MRTFLSRFLLATAAMVAPTQVWSQSAGQEGFNPNLLFTAWHIWAVQLHFPLIHWAAWMTVWRETDWRGNGLIVLTLTAGMWTALQNWSFLQGEWKRPSSLLMFRFTYIYTSNTRSLITILCSHVKFLCFTLRFFFVQWRKMSENYNHLSAKGHTDRQVKGRDWCRKDVG